MDAIERHYGVGKQGVQLYNELVDKHDGPDKVEVIENRDIDIATSADEAQDAPVIRLVNLILMNALEARASDIHVEPYEKTNRSRGASDRSCLGLRRRRR